MTNLFARISSSSIFDGKNQQQPGRTTTHSSDCPSRVQHGNGIVRRYYHVLCMMMVMTALKLGKSSAYIPPRPGTEFARTFESVDDMRRRLNITFTYEPTHLHRETCRYLTETECRRQDMAQQEIANNHRHPRRPMLSHQETGNTSTTTTTARRQLQSGYGSLNLLIVLVRFKDHADRDLPDPYQFRIQWNLRIRKWLDDNSYGQYVPRFIVTNWFDSDETEEYYNNGNYGRGPEFVKAFDKALDHLDKKNEGTYFKRMDRQDGGDGKIDGLIMLHSGYAAEYGGVDCLTGNGPEKRIWSHGYPSTPPEYAWTSGNGQWTVDRYMVTSALDGTCGSNQAKIAVMIHEFMHSLGLPDLFDTSKDDDPDAIGGEYQGGLGAFDVMAWPFGLRRDDDFPGYLSLWSKMYLGWITPTVVEEPQSIRLSPIANTESAIQISRGFPSPDTEYLLIENRQPIGFDMDLFAGGLVIYHVDETAPLMTQPGYPGQTGWPENSNHYQIAVLPADGRYDLEILANHHGDSGDMWMPGDVLAPIGDNYPNTQSYQQGSITFTGIMIEVLEIDQDGSMEVLIEFYQDESEYQKDNPVTLIPPKDHLAPQKDEESSSAAEAEDTMGVLAPEEEDEEPSYSSSSTAVFIPPLGRLFTLLFFVGHSLT